MLFNSFEFIYLFLPALLLCFYCLPLSVARLCLCPVSILCIGSLLFYSFGEWHYLWLLLGSICMNYCFGTKIQKAKTKSKAKTLFILSIVSNLGILAYFKYAGFFLGSFAQLIDLSWNVSKIALPLGISFFTFTQISFLVDCYRSKTEGIAIEMHFTRYLLFVTYFPHLIAGPILHHKPMMSQFKSLTLTHFKYQNIACGLLFFAIGLSKKVLIADKLIPYVDYVFKAENMSPISLIETYLAVLAYTFQLYFDFSGYCDMAIGISKMLNIDLPINFNSPYQAKNIIDFWRRWHITLSSFLRDYLYIPLGGSQKGSVRKYLNLLLTMLLGGLWHGAGWTFMIWGFLHGLFLSINHLWQALRLRFPRLKIPGFLASFITFMAVMIAWVYFRADSVLQANHIIQKIFSFSELIEQIKIGGYGILMSSTFKPKIILCLVALLAMVLYCPNSQKIVTELMERKQIHLFKVPFKLNAAFMGFSCSLLMFYIISNLNNQTAFLYFNF